MAANVKHKIEKNSLYFGLASPSFLFNGAKRQSRTALSSDSVIRSFLDGHGFAGTPGEIVVLALVPLGSVLSKTPYYDFSFPIVVRTIRARIKKITTNTNRIPQALSICAVVKSKKLSVSCGITTPCCCNFSCS